MRSPNATLHWLSEQWSPPGPGRQPSEGGDLEPLTLGCALQPRLGISRTAGQPWGLFLPSAAYILPRSGSLFAGVTNQAAFLTQGADVISKNLEAIFDEKLGKIEL